MPDSDIEEKRRFFAQQMAAASGWDDPRFERAVEIVPRELFLGPGPWRIMGGGHYLETPTDDASYIYNNCLVALDSSRGINNGEPFLHAAWIGKAAPRRGEIITHIGAGTGYYTAILSLLVAPNGEVFAYEIHDDLAARACDCLDAFEGVTVRSEDATTAKLPQSDIIYINAGVSCPLLTWLDALKPAGRMIFPWQPIAGFGSALLVMRVPHGFSAEHFMHCAFIPCIGASQPAAKDRRSSSTQRQQPKSIVARRDREPDETAIAVYDDLWFSSAPVPDG